MTCGHPGSTHGDEPSGRFCEVLEAGMELVDGTHSPIRLQCIGKRPVNGARDVTGDGIDGLGDPLIPLRSSCVHKLRAIRQLRRNLIR